MIRPHPSSTLFPYTTLFRSAVIHDELSASRLKRFEVGIGGIEVVRQLVIRRFRRRIEVGRLDLPVRIAIHHVPEEAIDRKSTRLNSSHQIISYAVFCLKKKR